MKAWTPPQTPEQVYGCALPLWLRLRRYSERAHEWRKEPIMLHPAHYAWLERELAGENEDRADDLADDRVDDWRPG